MNDLKLSLIFGVFSRIITFLNQVISVPLIITLIGLDEFTRYNVMTAGIAWLITLGGCLLPSIVGDIARANADSDTITIYRKVSSAIALMAVFCLIILVTYSMIFHAKSFELHALIFFSLIIVFASTAENIRQGLGENYKNSIYNGTANLISIIAVSTLYILKIETSLLLLLSITLGSVAILKVLNLIPLLKLVKTRYVDISSCKEMVFKAMGFVLISGAYYCNTAGMITILGLNNYAQLTEFVILQKIILIITGVIVMIRNPLWGVIAKMKYKGDGYFIFKNFKKTLKGYFILSPLILLIIWFGLNPFLSYWAKGVHIDSIARVVYSIYIIIMIFSYINSILYYGLEIFSKISKLLVIEAIINVVVIILLAKANSPLINIFISMIITSMCINILVFKLIKRACVNAQ